MLADPKVNLQSQELLTDPYCLVRQLMSLKGLLTATDKQVHTGELHQRPIQWHLKNHWRIPESLDARSYPSTFKMVTPNGTQPFRSSYLYRCLKRRLGGSLRRSLRGNKSGLLGPRPLFKQDGAQSNRQHHSCCLYKQGRRQEVAPTVCPTVTLNPETFQAGRMW